MTLKAPAFQPFAGCRSVLRPRGTYHVALRRERFCERDDCEWPNCVCHVAADTCYCGSITIRLPARGVPLDGLLVPR